MGTLRPGWDSAATLKRVAEDSWLRWLWNDDDKTEIRLAGDSEPCGDFHASAGDEAVDLYYRRVLAGAAADNRVVGRLGGDKPCTCGLGVPDRKHLTFDCPDKPWSGERRGNDEHRTLVPLIPLVRSTAFATDIPQDFVDFLAQRGRQVSYVTLALDGSCLDTTTRCRATRCGWGASALDGTTFHGPVGGLDQSAAAAERAALYMAVGASFQAQVPVKLLIDNDGVVRRLRRGVDRGRWQGDCGAFWAWIAAHWVAGSEVQWIPSHGKRGEWDPGPEWPPAAVCRAANAGADRAAHLSASRFAEGLKAATAARAAAKRWARLAVDTQYNATLPYWNAVKALWSQDGQRDDLVRHVAGGGRADSSAPA